MQFSSKEDIEAPIERVFGMLSEFEKFERMALRRGIEVQRADSLSEPGVGASWNARFMLRGRTRDLHLEVVDFDSPNGMRLDSESQGLQSIATIDLVSLSPKRTRMAVKVELTPKTLAARLLIQSLRLAKKNLNKRFRLKVAEFSKEMENNSGKRRRKRS